MERMAEFEYRVLTFSREVSRAEARRVLSDQAEYEHWEMTRLRLYEGGTRRVWLRRRVVRVLRTPGMAPLDWSPGPD